MTDARVFPDAGPLVIGGMHRSGTSLTASLFAGAGIDLGPELLGATRGNVRGHFEDLGILDFHMRALVAQGHGGEGYMTRPCDVPPLLEPVARRLVADRAARGRPWGWKEPRTILFLDFWDKILPNARYVFVFRPPWEVVDSIFRRGDAPFQDNPTLALDVWIHYNRTILDFARRHSERCLVLDIGQVIGDPAGALAAVRTRLDVPLGPPPACFEPALFTRDESPLHAQIVNAAAPAAGKLLAELREVAGCAQEGGTVSAPPEPAMTAVCALSEWSRACRAEVAVQEMLATQERTRQELARQELASREVAGQEPAPEAAPSAWRRWSRGTTKPVERIAKAALAALGGGRDRRRARGVRQPEHEAPCLVSS